jgi:hypothetical protein
MWHIEIPETSAAAVAEWVAHVGATELASIVRINNTPYYLIRHRVGWSEVPYDVILAAWGPAPLRQRLTPWSIQVEIRQGSAGTDVKAQCNAGDDLLEQFKLLTSMLQERWPSAKAQTSTVPGTDRDPDRAVSQYVASSADLFIDWLAERVESAPPPQAPSRWEMRPHPPRVHRRPTLTTLAIDVDILEPDRRADHREKEDTLRRLGHYPDAITFEARSYSLHDRDAVRVQATCHDPYRASYEAVMSLQAALGRGKTDRWPPADPWPLVAFFDALWEEIEDVWPRPSEGVPPATKEDEPGTRGDEPSRTPDQEAYPEPSSPSDDAAEPWTLIPKHRWDRTAVQMWCKGYQVPEIARRLNLSPGTIYNRLSKLRNEYPNARIPTDDERATSL